MGLLRPSETAATIFTIDYERLLAEGKRTLLFDLDNTLGRHGAERLPDRIVEFLSSLAEQGFAVGILTNRRRNSDVPAVHALRERFPVVHAAGKPARGGFLRLLAMLDGTPNDTVMIGDRRMTDILGANRLGIYSIRVRSRGSEARPHER